MANRQSRLPDDDDRDLADMFGRNFSGPGSALQGLLRKLGAMEDMMPGGMLGGMMSGGRLKAILQGLRSPDDEAAQLTALSELNELLSISSEDNLAGFPVESVVPLLVQSLNAEHSPDVMLLAARALTFLADVLPPSCASIVRHGAVPAFCARLLTIEYIDLAEQSLQALEKLSHEHAPSLLQNGGLLAVLSYLDFFPTGVQRTAVATAANLCRSLTQSPSVAASGSVQSAVREAIPMLTGLLSYQDAKVVDSACQSLSYIAEASAAQPALLEALTGGGLVGQATQLIGLSDSGAMTSQLSVSTYYGLLKLLATAAASSASVATTLMNSGAVSTARTLLATSPLLSNTGTGTLLRTPDHLHEVLGLLVQLLPPAPDVAALVTTGGAVALGGAEAGAAAAGQESRGAGAGAGVASAGESPAQRGTALGAYLAAHPELTQQLCGEMLPLVLSSYSATVLPEVRTRALRLLLQLLTCCPAEQLRGALRSLPLASFLAGLLAGRDAATAAAALLCCEVLMAQLPDVFKHVFLREGVAHAVEQLAATAAAAAAAAVPAAVAPAPAGPPAAPAPAEEPRRFTRFTSLLSSRDDKEKEKEKEKDKQQQQQMLLRQTSSGPRTAAAAAGDAAAGGAAAAGGSRNPPSSAPSSTQALKAALAARAQRFKDAHYNTGCGAPETEGVVQVRQLLQQLPSDPAGTLSQLLVLMAASADNAAGRDGPPPPRADGASATNISVFELLNSGAVKSLHAFLTGADLPAAQTEAQADERATAILRRVAMLARVGLTPREGAACNPPLVGLLRKLQAALASVEVFPVLYGQAAPPPSSGGLGGYGGRSSYSSRGAGGGGVGGAASSSLSNGLSLLTHPLKLRLARHTGDSSLRDYSGNIVLIEPLATMTAIEEFLWPRVYRGPSGGSSAAAAAQAAQAAAAAAQAAAAAAERKAGLLRSAAAGAPGGATSGRVSPKAAGAGTGAEGAGRSAGAATGGGTSAAGSAAARSQPIPVAGDPNANRRVTRSQAAREKAEAEAVRQSSAVPVPTRGNSRGRNAAAASDKDAGGDGGSAGGSAGGRSGRTRRRSGGRGGDAAGEPPAGAADPLQQQLSSHDSPGLAHVADRAEDEEEEMDDDLAYDMDGPGDALMFDADDGDFDDDDDAMHHHDEDDEDDADGGIRPAHVHDLQLGEAQEPARAPLAAAAGAGADKGKAGSGAKPGGQQPPDGAGSGAGAAGSGPGAKPGNAWGSRAGGDAGGAATGAGEAAAAPGAAAAGGGGGGSSSRSAAHEAAAPKLTFVLPGDEALDASTTVFQAIHRAAQQQQQRAGGAEGAAEEGEEADGDAGAGQRRGRRLWEEVHTLYYRPAPARDAGGAGAAAAGAAPAAGGAAAGSAAATGSGAGTASGGGAAPADAAAGGSDVGRWGSTPLRELLVQQLPPGLSCPAAVREVLALLQLLEAVNRLGLRAVAELDAASGGGLTEACGEAVAGPLQAVRHVAREEFVSGKLASKLGQQLKDVVAVCGGSMPAWCGSLVGPCRFLFPLEVRKRYFYCTAFGLGRALQHMQAMAAAEGGGAPAAAAADRDRELRVGRLQRTKVRVSRRRILESAVKVMELYGRSRSVLELEYFNEVGTGLGPTLEFYTLLSHELQRKDLGMWRHEEQDKEAKQEEKEAGEGEEQQGAAGGEKGSAGGQEAGGAASPAASAMEVDGSPRQGQGQQVVVQAAGPVTAVSVPMRRGEASHHHHQHHHHNDGGGGDKGGPAPAASSEDYVNAPWGLFPRPLPPDMRPGGPAAAAGRAVLEHFKLLGRTVAKALQDNRLLDLPLSHVFYAAAQGTPLDLWDVSRLDPGLGATLQRLHTALAAHRASAATGAEAGPVSRPLLVDGVPLEDLCITFELPGYPGYPLRPGGADAVVSTPQELGEYIAAVVDATLGSGIAAQMGAFREGFNEVFSLSTLSVFHEDEVEVLLCGSGERWTLQSLAEAIKFDHGYTATSTPVRYLLEILSELNAADQRAFLRFVTGCPRLPPGGLAALQPRLTVVRKHPSGTDGPSTGPTPVGSFQEAGVLASLGSGGPSGGAPACAADADLPSVMTCANYIKLPPYSSKEVMAARLMYAIREGQGSFDLS